MKKIKGLTLFTITALIALQGCKKAEQIVTTKQISTGKILSLNATISTSPLFTNDLGGGMASDPWVFRAGGNYYYCGTTGGSLWVAKSATLQNIMTQTRTTIYTPPGGTDYSGNLWAPELHYRSGRWYVYFAADNGDNANHRMHVLQGGTDANDPLNGTYTYKAKLAPTTDRWAIDGHPFDYNGQAYFVWSGWEGTTNAAQFIYIARMSNPYTISGERVEISRPDYSWEKIGSPQVNEGPTTLQIGNRLSIIYSASGSWTDDYCLGRISTTSTNLMAKSSWTKLNVPVFKKVGNIYGPGHASFTKSPDGLQNWIVYHCATSAGSGWDRKINIQQFNYEADLPYFGFPIEKGVWIPAPSIGTSYAMPLANGTYRVKSRASNLVLDVPNSQSTIGLEIQQYTDNGSSAQKWVFTSLGNGYYKIISAVSGLALSNPTSKNAGAIVVQSNYTGSMEQQWRVQDMTNGNFQLTNRLSLMNLNLPNSNPAVGTKIDQWYINNFDAELWQIIP